MTAKLTDQPVAPRSRRKAANHRLRRVLPYAGGLVLVGLISAGLWPQPVPVETARVVVGRLRATVNEEGKTRIQHRFVVASPVTGQLRRIALRPGDEVQSPQKVVAVIDPLPPALLDARTRTTAEARRQAASDNLEKARANYALAASELKSCQKLYADKAVAILDLERAQARAATASREQAAAQSALREAEAELDEFVAGNSNGPPSTPAEVRAPAAGRVLRVFEENARVVSAGTPLLEMGDPADLEVVIEVLSRDGAAIAPGTPVELDQWGAGPPLAARVRLVEPAAFTKVSALGVEEQRVNVVADLLTPPGQRPSLGDNFRVEAQIIVWEQPQVLKVPAGALFRQGQQWASFRVANGRTRLQPVRVGRSSGAETQVLAGLKEGDTVVMYPGERVRSDQRVRLIQVGPKSE